MKSERFNKEGNEKLKSERKWIYTKSVGIWKIVHEKMESKEKMKSKWWKKWKAKKWKKLKNER